MTQLNKKAIRAIYKIQGAIGGTGFYLNRFSVSDNMLKEITIEFDIREEKDEGNNTE